MRPIFALFLVPMIGCSGMQRHCHASGRLYGTPSEALVGKWSQHAPFYGMDLEIRPGSVAFSSYGERQDRSTGPHFAFAKGDEIVIILPEERTALTYTVMEVDGEYYLLSDIELGRYRALEGAAKARFQEHLSSTGRKRVAD